MPVQNRTDYSTDQFVRSGTPLYKEAETVKTDGARVGDMAKNTVMSYDSATKKWVPFTDETAVDGTQIPKGFLKATLSEAEIKAGDVLNVPILVGRDITVTRSMAVIENAKTLDTIINVPVNLKATVEELLRWTGIYVESTIDVDGYEN